MSVPPSRSYTAPKVSILVAMYNAERYIAATIRSALCQTYENIEVIVVDDGSTDESPVIVERLAAVDPRVRLIRQENGGAAVARNAGLAVASGKYIAPLDADDIFDARKIERQVAHIEAAGPSVGLVYCWTQRIDNDGYVLSRNTMCGMLRGRCFESLIATDPVGHGSGVLVRRDALVAAGGFDQRVCPAGSAGCEDQKLLLDIANKYAIDYVPEILVGYRKTDGNATRNIEKMSELHGTLLDIIRGAHPEIPDKDFIRSHTKVVFWLITDAETPGALKANFGYLIRTLMNDPGFCLTPWFLRWTAGRLKRECLRPLFMLANMRQKMNAGPERGEIYMSYVYDPLDSERADLSKMPSASIL